MPSPLVLVEVAGIVLLAGVLLVAASGRGKDDE